MKKKFGNYLEEFMKKNNYTLEYIAIQTGASLSVVGHYRKGIRIPKDEFVENFIDKFIKNEKEKNLIRYYVAYDRSPQMIQEKLDERERISAESTTTEKEAEIVKLPFLGKAAAGKGYMNFDESKSFKIIDSIPKSGLPKEAFMLEVSGDSMQPTLQDGDYLIINPINTDIQNLKGKICVFTYHDQTYVKRLGFTNKEILLISDNEDKSLYGDIKIDKEQLEYLKCYGVVLESRRKH